MTASSTGAKPLSLPDLRAAIHGRLITPADADYDQARAVFYGGFEKRPAVIVRAADDADVAHVVTLAAATGLPLAVRSGGHSNAGQSVVEGGIVLDDTVKLVQLLKNGGKVDLIDASSGGLDPRQKIPLFPGYQVQFAAELKRRTGIATGAVGMINAPDLAEQILASGQADLIIMARALLNDPYWPLHAAKVLKAKIAWPPQYERGDVF